MKTLLFFILMLFSLPALAGGSGEFVNLVSFDLKADGKSYTLVVKPNKEPYEHFLKRCTTFTVKGTFYNSWKEVLTFSGKNYSSHKKAINYLKDAQGEIFFGYIGQGFEKIGNNKCIVRSEALEISTSSNMIYSYIKMP